MTRENLLETAASIAPTPEQIQNVKDVIGMPPKATIFYKLVMETGMEENTLSRALDVLYERKEISITNGWIHGVKNIDVSKWTNDDWAWFTGSGRYAQ